MIKHELAISGNHITVTSSFDGFNTRSRFENTDPVSNYVWADRMMALNETTLFNCSEYRRQPMQLIDAEGNLHPLKCLPNA